MEPSEDMRAWQVRAIWVREVVTTTPCTKTSSGTHNGSRRNLT